MDDESERQLTRSSRFTYSKRVKVDHDIDNISKEIDVETPAPAPQSTGRPGSKSSKS